MWPQTLAPAPGLTTANRPSAHSLRPPDLPGALMRLSVQPEAEAALGGASSAVQEHGQSCSALCQPFGSPGPAGPVVSYDNGQRSGPTPCWGTSPRATAEGSQF